MSEALDHVRQVCAEFDRANPHWREIAESDKTRARERQQREIDAERERREACKTREADDGVGKLVCRGRWAHPRTSEELAVEGD